MVGKKLGGGRWICWRDRGERTGVEAHAPTNHGNGTCEISEASKRGPDGAEKGSGRRQAHALVLSPDEARLVLEAEKGQLSLLHKRYQATESSLSHIEFPGEAANPEAHIEHFIDHATSILNVEHPMRK
jgi:hypothetical protein